MHIYISRKSGCFTNAKYVDIVENDFVMPKANIVIYRVLNPWVRFINMDHQL